MNRRLGGHGIALKIGKGETGENRYRILEFYLGIKIEERLRTQAQLNAFTNRNLKEKNVLVPIFKCIYQ